MKIGDREIEKQPCMYDWEGIFSEQTNIPQEMMTFIEEQHKRFNVALPPEEVIRYTIEYTYTALTRWDPYSWFSGITDVECTQSWMDHTYEIMNLDGEKVEVDPEELETFRIFPGRDLTSFNDAITNPGLGNLPCGIGSLIDEFLDGECTSGESVMGCLSPHAAYTLREMSHNNPDTVKAHVHLIAWSAACWMIGPMGKEYRRDICHIFDTCYEYGECIVFQGYVYSPNEYKVVNRAPRSCVICGLDSWCVEMVHLDGMTRYICEHHVNPTLCHPYIVEVNSVDILSARITH